MEEQIKELEMSMLKCQSQVYKDLHSLTTDVHKTVERVGVLEIGHAEIKGTLEQHEAQRRGYQEKLESKLDQLIEYVGAVRADTDQQQEFIDKVIKYKVRITFISLGVGSTVGALYWLYTFLSKHGLVIVFETAANNAQ